MRSDAPESGAFSLAKIVKPTPCTTGAGLYYVVHVGVGSSCPRVIGGQVDPAKRLDDPEVVFVSHEPCDCYCSLLPVIIVDVRILIKGQAQVRYSSPSAFDIDLVKHPFDHWVGVRSYAQAACECKQEDVYTAWLAVN